MDLRKKVLVGLSWSAGARLLSQIFTWTITIIVMRLLIPGDYGLMAMAGFFINFLTLMNELGLGAALIQKKEIDDLFLRQIFGLLLVSNFIFFLMLYASAPLIAIFFSEQRISPIIRISAIQFIMMSFSIIPQSLLMRSMDFKNLSIIDLMSAITQSLVTLILALIGYGVWSLVWGNLTFNLIRTTGLIVASRFICIPSFSMKGLSQTMFFGGYVMISRILWYFYTQADTFIIGKFLGKELLGFYSVSMQLASLPMEKTSGIINQVAFPAFSSIQDDYKKAANYFLKAVRIGSFFAFPILWGISSIAPNLIAILLGDKWQIAAMPLQLISLVIPIRMISNMMSPMLMGIGRADIHFLNVSLASVMMVLGILIGVHWGVLGVSLAWVIVFPAAFLLNMSRVVKVLKIKLLDVVKAMEKPAFGAFIMFVVVISINVLWGIDIKSVKHLIALIFIGLVVYAGMIMSLNKEGYHELIGLVRK